MAHQDPKRVVAVIDGNNITAEQADGLLKMVPESQRRSIPSVESAVQQLYMIQQLSAEAAKLNLDQESPWKEQIRLDRERIMGQAYLDRLSKSKSGPEPDTKQYYDTHSDEFDQAKVSGIFVAFNTPGTPAGGATTSRTEQQARDKANDLEKKLKGGADFAALAKSDSDNAQAAARGGEMGTVSGGATNVPAEVKTAIFKLQSGQISDPVRVQNGFYIFKVETRSKQTYDQARSQIAQKLENDRNQAVMKEQYDKYKIQVKDPDFFNASNSPAANIPSLQRPASPATSPSTKPQGQK